MYKKETCYEQKQQVKRNSYRFGWMGTSIALIVLLGFRWYANESPADLLLILSTQLASVFFYQYKKLNHKGYLIAVILMVGGILMNFAALLTQYGVF
jgi:hypothetical protein